MKVGSPVRGRRLEDFEQYDFSGGINIQDSPQKLEDRDLSSAINVYLDSDGDIATRLGMTKKGSQISASAAQNIFRFYQTISNGAVSTNKLTVMQIGGTLYDADTGALLSSTNQLGMGALPMSCVRVFDPSHATSPPSGLALVFSSAAGTLVAGTYPYVVTAITPGGETLPCLSTSITTVATGEVVLSWNARVNATGYNVYRGGLKIANNIPGTTFTDDGSAIPAGAPPTTTTATAAPSDVLVICTGVGGPYAYDGVITYTFPTGPTTTAGARWCQLITNVLWFGGISSQPNVVVGSALGTPESQPGYAVFSMSSPVTGLGTLGVGLQANLVVGMVQGLTLITGFTPNSYIEQEVPNQDGVTAGRSMITVDGILYFIGNYAIYRYDGSQFTEVSRKVRPWILNDPLYQQFPMNSTNRQTSWAMYWNHRLYFWYSSLNASGPPNTALVLDMGSGGWTIYTGPTLNGGAILNAPTDVDPAVCVVCDASKGQQYNFDVYADSQLNASDDGVAIQASFLSKYFKLGNPGMMKHLLMVQPELFVLNLSGVLSVAADYGAALKQAVVSSSNTGSLWDSAIWDAASAVWSGTGLNYIVPRIDTNLYAEAIAFGFQTPNPGTVSPAPYQPWKFMGVTGRVSVWPRHTTSATVS